MKRRVEQLFACLQSEEQRLTRRLGKLNLEMKVMAGDGNCQVRLFDAQLKPHRGPEVIGVFVVAGMERFF